MSLVSSIWCIDSELITAPKLSQQKQPTLAKNTLYLSKARFLTLDSIPNAGIANSCLNATNAGNAHTGRLTLPRSVPVLVNERLESLSLFSRHGVRNASAHITPHGKEITGIIVLVLLSELNEFLSTTEWAAFCYSDFRLYAFLRRATAGTEETTMWAD